MEHKILKNNIGTEECTEMKFVGDPKMPAKVLKKNSNEENGYSTGSDLDCEIEKCYKILNSESQIQISSLDTCDADEFNLQIKESLTFLESISAQKSKIMGEESHVKETYLNSLKTQPSVFLNDNPDKSNVKISEKRKSIENGILKKHKKTVDFIDNGIESITDNELYETNFVEGDTLILFSEGSDFEIEQWDELKDTDTAMKVNFDIPNSICSSKKPVNTENDCKNIFTEETTQNSNLNQDICKEIIMLSEKNDENSDIDSEIEKCNKLLNQNNSDLEECKLNLVKKDCQIYDDSHKAKKKSCEKSNVELHLMTETTQQYEMTSSDLIKSKKTLNITPECANDYLDSKIISGNQTEQDSKEVKKTNIDYLEEEKDDIINPEWEKIKNLTTNEERYKQVRDCWKSQTVPDPNKNLTYHSYKKKWCTEARPIRQHKRCASSNLQERNAKRPCTFFLDKEINSIKKTKDQKKREIINEMHFKISNIDQQYVDIESRLRNRPHHFSVGYDSYNGNFHNQFNNRISVIADSYNRIADNCESSFRNKIGTLSERRNEVLKFYSFYKGLNDSSDPTLLTESQFQELNEIENIYEQFNHYYKNE